LYQLADLRLWQEIFISNLHMSSVASHIGLQAAHPSNVYSKVDRLQHRALLRRRVIRYGLIGFNAVLLFAVAAFVLVGQHSSGDSTNTLQSSSLTTSPANNAATNPLDQISSADIAYNVAAMDALPETTAVANQAASVNLELSAPPATASIVTKPQVVNTALKSRQDIQTYAAENGDTVASIAAKFNVTSDSIKWSNNLTSNTVAAGQSLQIPPEGVSGIVYFVKAGDTPDTLAAKYKANRDEIIAYNDAELTPLQVGERIIIPNGSITPAPVVAQAASFGLAWGTTAIYGSNGYDPGYCTWYVATRISVPANWGNADTWDNGAEASGWTVSSTPRAGAIAQTDRGAEGHVAVVEAVSADGTEIKYSDMNGLAGFDREGHSWTIGPYVSNGGWAPASLFEHYIYQ
jgi:surface antigen